MTAKPNVISDTECYSNFWSIGFKRVGDGKVLKFEKSDRCQLDVERIRSIMTTHRCIGYNWQTYDLPMIVLALEGKSNAELKLASDRIIKGNLKYWDVEDALGIRIPREFSFIDLIEPQPNAFAGLKILNGRLHGQRMQDLPYEPDSVLTHEQMDLTLAYMGNDIDATHILFDAMKEPLALREALGAEYRMNFLSKSDSQIGEAIVKKRVEQEQNGERVQRVPTAPGTSFNYRIPAFMRFETPKLQAMLERLRTTEFFVRHDGKVDLPDWLSDFEPTIGETVYAMGIGGLHSKEAARAVYSDDDHQLIDFDVASYYPAIIIGSGLYPKSLGSKFLEIYRRIRDERIAAKRKAADKSLPDAEREKHKVAAEGLKIALNGIFGKLGSPYSVLYAPHLMIAVTLTGQLALLMLIERAELAGIPVVSANTDGVVFRCPASKRETLTAITKQWEADTGFELESTNYKALYSASVNEYIAVKDDGKAKRKGKLANPRKEGMRDQLMKNPNMGVCTDAVVEFLTKGTPIEQHIRECRDIRDFVTVVTANGGATWRGDYLGKVVRYIWARDGEEILYRKPDPRTGNFKKVSKTDGCRPVMDLPDEFPTDIDYDRYIAEAHEILMTIGANERPPEIKPIRIHKYNAILWFAVAV